MPMSPKPHGAHFEGDTFAFEGGDFDDYDHPGKYLGDGEVGVSGWPEDGYHGGMEAAPLDARGAGWPGYDYHGGTETAPLPSREEGVPDLTKLGLRPSSRSLLEASSLRRPPRQRPHTPGPR